MGPIFGIIFPFKFRNNSTKQGRALPEHYGMLTLMINEANYGTTCVLYYLEEQLCNNKLRIDDLTRRMLIESFLSLR